jgi:signal transduction histidine kinase
MIGQSILKIIPPELHADETLILETIARGERIQHFETVRLTKDARRIDVFLTISPVKDDAGRIVGAAKIARDISQQKQAERALRTTERLAAVGRLAATVAHEINNPLEAVTNLVYLAKSVAVRDDVREFLAGAEEELGRVAQMTKQTLGFYRETKGIATVHVGSTVESLMSVFSPKVRNKGIKIRSEIKGEVAIQAVAGEIRQLIGNLLSNSIDAVAAGGEIRIRVAAVQHHGNRGVRLIVSDNGPGIPEHVRMHIFEPFFTTKNDVGTGLGLWVCKSIVQRHQGSIRLRSSTLQGRSGTVFSVFLPSLVRSAIEDAFRQAV